MFVSFCSVALLKHMRHEGAPGHHKHGESKAHGKSKSHSKKGKAATREAPEEAIGMTTDMLEAVRILFLVQSSSHCGRTRTVLRIATL